MFLCTCVRVMSDSPVEPGAQPVGVEPEGEGDFVPVTNSRRFKRLRVHSDDLPAPPHLSFVIQITPIEAGKSLNRVNALRIAKEIDKICGGAVKSLAAYHPMMHVSRCRREPMMRVISPSLSPREQRGEDRDHPILTPLPYFHQNQISK